jgi:hypothetical protein
LGHFKAAAEAIAKAAAEAKAKAEAAAKAAAEKAAAEKAAAQKAAAEKAAADAKVVFLPSISPRLSVCSKSTSCFWDAIERLRHAMSATVTWVRLQFFSFRGTPFAYLHPSVFISSFVWLGFPWSEHYTGS